MQTASVSPSSAPSVAELQEPIKGMLERWNWYREGAGVPPISADPQLSEAAALHSKYLIENHIQGADAFIENGKIRDEVANPAVREESPGNTWHTRAGARAAASAYIIRTGATSSDGASLVDEIVSRGLNVLGTLNPQLTAFGYGEYCENHECVLTVASKVGLSRDQFVSVYEDSPFVMPFMRPRLRQVIFFPSPKEPAAIASFDGAAKPNPQTSCGYSGTSGPAIVLEVGAPSSGGNDVLLSSHSLSDNGVEVESCAFDASDYKNPDGYQQAYLRQMLHGFGAIVLLPREPLTPGHTYTVSVTADGTPYTWNFTVAPDAK